MKIVFIGCVKSKEDHKCEAKDLYISPLFEKSFAYANQLIEGGVKYLYFQQNITSFHSIK